MKYKALAILLCLATVLTMALPGTLAVAVYEDGSSTVLTVETSVPGDTDPDENATEAPDPTENVEPATESTEGEKAELFYNAVMSAETADALEQALSQYSSEEMQTLQDGLNEEKRTALYQHVGALYPSDPVPDYSGVALTNAGPFLPAVQAVSLFSARDAAAEESGLILDKTATYDAQTDTYKISLEAFVTGKVTISDVEKVVPTDIVLVLDSSGSMDDYITIGDKNDPSVLDTVYGAAEGVYQLNDSLSGYGSMWRDMMYDEDEWYYRGWAFQTGKWLKLSEAWAQGKDIRIKKIDALKIAAQQFVDQVNAKNTDSNGNIIGHQIAVVDFDSDGAKVIDLTSVATGSSTIKTAITGLDAQGATRADSGMQRAKEILSAIPSTRESNRVVVMFTDGEPTSGSSFEDRVANEAISTSKDIKADGATVYTIGVFDKNKLDTSPVTSNTSKLNKFMHYVSSNFKNAESMTKGNEATYPETGSYYLGATNATELNAIFKSISDQIHTGGASITLDASTVVKDVVAPQFTAPTNSSDIQIYTAPYQGYDDDGERKFGTAVKSKLNANIATDGSIQVSGFDFSSDENCVTDTTANGATTYSGNKLIIEFTVKAKNGFLGGNDVYTNSEANVTNGSFSQNFPKPTVNVPIKEITITAADKNVYLTQVPGASDLKSGVTIKCGDVDITDPSKLEDWQKAYVTIDSGLTTSDGFAATTDGTYSVTATVKPNTSGNTTDQGTVATEQMGTATKAINVFTPELTFCDSEVYYGDNAPTGYTGNLIETQWKHGQTLDTAVSMIGSAPSLTQVYTTESGKIVDGKIATKQDIGVDVAVKIGTTDVTNKSAFNHKECQGKTCAIPEGKEFLLHVKTCSLTVTKTGTNVENDPFVFNIKKDGELYTQVTITGKNTVTISELPVGTYTVEEDTDWSWRYTSSFDKSSVVLSATNNADTITCTNTKENHNWLNHFTSVINTYGDKKQS